MHIASNTTPFRAESFVSVDKHGRKHAVVVVKATFDVGADSECRVAELQAPFVYADQHHGDPGTTALRYESDFAPGKPRADVLLDAEAVAPSGQEVTALDVGFAGPGFVKRARVNGDRHWDDGLGGVRPSEPRPFRTLPLVWDRAFGGSDHSHEEERRNGSELRNPVGLGFHLNGRKKTILGKALPNIERHDDGMRSWSDKPEPVGFGPLGRAWHPRIGFAGTYDQRWMDEKLPFLPDDFDDRYFLSAPLDQQLPELTAGDTFRCLNMNEAGRFVVCLPRFSVPLRFRFDDRAESAALTADTLVLEPGLSRIVLIGRTSRPLPRKFTTLREIEVGPAKYRPTPGKPRFRRLGDAVAALRRQRPSR